MKHQLCIGVACLALVACSKVESGGSDEPGSAFKKGQKVTLSVSASSETKLTSSLNGDNIDFKWVQGDTILVTSGGTSAQFYATELRDDGKSAIFEGEMPATGNTFDVQYPITTPNLSSQEYSSTEALPHRKMLVKANGCQLGKSISLEPQYSAIRLNLYGTDITVGKIKVTTSESPANTYSLVFPSAGVSLGTLSDPTKFFIVMPACTTALAINVLKTDNSEICTFNVKETSYSVNKVKNMPVSKVIPATDLSSSGTANCYIVSSQGKYKFKTVQGNSTASVGDIKGVKVLWESFGTGTAPSAGDIVKTYVSYYDNYITFSTNDTYKEGNAVIAAYSDAACSEDNVLWSWHIWLTDAPDSQTYNNSAGTMMDRNIGATSATPGDAGALGLLYQWGRKDPFLNSSSISGSTQAASTLATWPTQASQDNSSDAELNLRTSIKYPTTFITNNTSTDFSDWYCSNASYKNDNLWKSEKTIYDPCPAGWRVPDGGNGGSGGIWAKAFKTDTTWTTTSNWDETHKGMNFGSTDKTLGSGTIWYPAGGHRESNGSLNLVSNEGWYWSCSPSYNKVYFFDFYNNGKIYPNSEHSRVYGMSVRCVSN